MKFNNKVMMLLMVGLIILNVGAAAVSANEKQTLDTGECILWTADGYVDPEAADAGEADDDDAAGEDADEEGDVDEGGDDDDASEAEGDDDDDDASEAEGDDNDDDAAGEDADEEGDVDEGGEDDAAEGDDAADEAGIAGSIAVDETALDGLTAEARCEALTTQATTTLEEAQAAAEAETGSVVVKVELDVENGFLVYSIDLEDGTGVTVDAGNGAVLATEAEDDAASEDEEDEADATAPSDTGITEDEARAIAEAETGSTAVDVEYDVEGGVEIWEVEMEDGTDVQVDAHDGTVLGVEERDAD